MTPLIPDLIGFRRLGGVDLNGKNSCCSCQTIGVGENPLSASPFNHSLFCFTRVSTCRSRPSPSLYFMRETDRKRDEVVRFLCHRLILQVFAVLGRTFCTSQSTNLST